MAGGQESFQQLAQLKNDANRRLIDQECLLEEAKCERLSLQRLLARSEEECERLRGDLDDLQQEKEHWTVEKQGLQEELASFILVEQDRAKALAAERGAHAMRVLQEQDEEFNCMKGRDVTDWADLEEHETPPASTSPSPEAPIAQRQGRMAPRIRLLDRQLTSTETQTDDPRPPTPVPTKSRGVQWDSKPPSSSASCQCDPEDIHDTFERPLPPSRAPAPKAASGGGKFQAQVKKLNQDLHSAQQAAGDKEVELDVLKAMIKQRDAKEKATQKGLSAMQVRLDEARQRMQAIEISRQTEQMEASVVAAELAGMRERVHVLEEGVGALEKRELLLLDRCKTLEDQVTCTRNYQLRVQEEAQAEIDEATRICEQFSDQVPPDDKLKEEVAAARAAAEAAEFSAQAYEVAILQLADGTQPEIIVSTQQALAEAKVELARLKEQARSAEERKAVRKPPLDRVAMLEAEVEKYRQLESMWEQRCQQVLAYDRVCSEDMKLRVGRPPRMSPPLSSRQGASSRQSAGLDRRQSRPQGLPPRRKTGAH